MRLDVAHEVGLALSATIAFLVVLAGGELSPVAWALLLAPWVSLALRLRERAAPALSGSLLALASVGLGLATLAQRGMEAAVLAGGYALAGLLAARLLTRTSYAHDLQALVLSLLLVMAGSVLNVGVSYGALFLLYGVGVVWSLTTRQLLSSAERFLGGGLLEGKEKGRLAVIKGRRDVVTPAFLGVTAGVAVAVLVATGVVFVSFPRIGFGSLSMFSPKSGRFPNAVSLRGAPRASAGGEEVIARVRGVSRAAFERGLYLRGAVYDAIDEHGFSQLEPPPPVRPSQLALASAPEEGVYDVQLSPVAGRLLFTLGPTLNAVALGGGRSNPSHRMGIVGSNTRTELLATSSLEASFRYRVRGGIATPGYVPVPGDRPVLERDRARALLAVPEDLDPRVQRLADEVVAGAASPSEKAARLREFLLKEFRYTLEQPNGGAEVPLRAFLLEERSGHCEYFASAYALLLRSQGIAARVVGGYQGGAWDDSEDVVVFQGKNAHAWVEWFLEGAGWIVDDPTPLATAARAELDGIAGLLERLRRLWDDRVVDFSLQDQTSALRNLRGGLSSDLTEGASAWVLGALGLVVLLGTFVALLRRRRGGEGGAAPGHRVGEALAAALERCRQARLPPELTLREALFALDEGRVSGDERRVLVEALSAYEQDRFGGVALDEARVEALVEALSGVPAREGEARAAA